MAPTTLASVKLAEPTVSVGLGVVPPEEDVSLLSSPESPHATATRASVRVIAPTTNTRRLNRMGFGFPSVGGQAAAAVVALAVAAVLPASPPLSALGVATRCTVAMESSVANERAATSRPPAKIF